MNIPKPLLNKITRTWVTQLREANIQPTREGLSAFEADITRLLIDYPEQLEHTKNPEKLKKAVSKHVAVAKKKAKRAGARPGLFYIVDPEVVRQVRLACPHEWAC